MRSPRSRTVSLAAGLVLVLALIVAWSGRGPRPPLPGAGGGAAGAVTWPKAVDPARASADAREEVGRSAMDGGAPALQAGGTEAAGRSGASADTVVQEDGPVAATTPASPRRAGHAATSAPPRPADGAPLVDGAFEVGWFDLRVGRHMADAPLETRVDARGRVLLPLAAMLDELEIPYRRTDGRLVLEWPPEVWQSVVDVEARSITVGDSIMRYASTDWVVDGGELYLSPRVATEALNARVEVDFASLGILVADVPRLPVLARLERESRRDRGQVAPSPFVLDPYADVPYGTRTGGVAAGWAVTVADDRGSTHSTLAGSLGGSVLGGATELGATGILVDGAPSRIDDVIARHTRAFPGSSWVRRLDVGTVMSEGTRPRRVVGFSITNEPFTTPRHFGETALVPSVPAGWEYEVYQGERLVGVSTSADPTGVRTALGYGSNPVTVRMIGPAGQVIDQEVVYHVPASRVQPGTWRYDVAGGACRDADCDQSYTGELARGVTPWLTTGVGGDWTVDAGASTIRPFTKLGISPRPDVSAEVQFQPSTMLRTGLSWVGGSRGTFSAYYTRSADDGPGPNVSRWVGQTQLAGPVSLLDGRWLTARFVMRGSDIGGTESWQGALSTTFGRTHVGLEVESGLQQKDLGTIRLFHTMAGSRLPGWLSDASVTAALGAGTHGLEFGEIGTTLRTPSRAELDMRLRLRSGHTPRLSVGLSLRSAMGFFRARSTRSDGVSSFVGADGGVAYTPTAGFHADARPTVGWSGVSGIVFHDLDGDGRRGPGEPGAEGVTVVADGRRVRTDAEGRYRVWGLMPYEGATVAVDPLSAGAEWAAPRDATRIRPAPNAFSDVDIPLRLTRELLGSVVTDDPEPRGVGRLLVEVVDETGEVVATTRTFSDGVFYVERLRPGRYELRIHARGVGSTTAGTRPADTAAVRAFVVPEESGAPVELDPVRLERR